MSENDEQDHAVTEIYRRLLWHHMDALRKGDEAKRARIFAASEVMVELWPDEIKAWEDQLPPLPVKPERTLK